MGVLKKCPSSTCHEMIRVEQVLSVCSTQEEIYKWAEMEL